MGIMKKKTRPRFEIIFVDRKSMLISRADKPKVDLSRWSRSEIESVVDSVSTILKVTKMRNRLSTNHALPGITQFTIGSKEISCIPLIMPHRRLRATESIKLIAKVLNVTPLKNSLMT